MALTGLVDMAQACGYFKPPSSGGIEKGWYPPSPIAPAPIPEGWTVPAAVPVIDGPPEESWVFGHSKYSLQESDPHGRSPNAPGAKLDAGKVRPWLCIAGFSHALNEVAKITTKGAEKYTPNGWAEVPNGADRYMEAFGRHMLALGTGEVFDNGPKGLGPDIYHKASMIWNLLASLELELKEKNDNS